MLELSIVSLVLASIPASMVAINLWLYRAPRERGKSTGRSAVSVLIPARDEEASIAAAVESVLASRGVELEVLVMDDHSRDRTAEIVRRLAASDRRVRLESAPPLPSGWCGKQHACHELAHRARNAVLVFLDADVRLEPHALAAIVDRLESGSAELISGVPRQITGTWMEKLVVPLIHFVLLGFLPLLGMRRSRSPAYAAGCGQLFAACRGAYEETGGHAAVRSSRHDGVTLPRAFRKAGFRTDLFDATGIARCRMYRSAGEVWRGFVKNATEGMAAPAAILPWTVLLAGGQVLPPLLLGLGLSGAVDAGRPALALAGLATGLAFLTRWLLALRFRHSPLGALLHPVGILLVLAIQWCALLGRFAGRSPTWKGRVQLES